MKQVKDFLRQDVLSLALFAGGLFSVAAIGAYVFRVIGVVERMAVTTALVVVMAFSLAALYSVYSYISANRAAVYREELAAEASSKVVNL